MVHHWKSAVGHLWGGVSGLFVAAEAVDSAQRGRTVVEHFGESVKVTRVEVPQDLGERMLKGLGG